MRHHRGLTLVELLFVLALSAILLGLGGASFDSLIQRQRLRTAVADLVAAIDLTRAQAMARGGRVLLAPLAGDGASWEQGWAVFIDDNGNRRPDPGEMLLQRHDAVAAGISIASAFTSAAAPHYLAYNGAGRSCSADNSLAAHWGTLSVRQGAQARHIKINMLGRVRVCDPATQPTGCSGAAEG
jgi:type IV fimbrial biogenesis protein FimT